MQEYPWSDVTPREPSQYVSQTYLQFLWLPEVCFGLFASFQGNDSSLTRNDASKCDLLRDPQLPNKYADSGFSPPSVYRAPQQTQGCYATCLRSSSL